MTGKKCVVSYSGGKDSALALYRCIQNGYEPQALIVTYNKDAGRSWFHGIPESLLSGVAEATGIPVRMVKTGGGDSYNDAFCQVLKEEKEKGAQACVFGDIDIEGHREWCVGVCQAAGMEAYHPLWQESREALVRETIRLGFAAYITTLDTRRLGKRCLGLQLSEEVLDMIAQDGADVCGENGEYHTFVADGPVFRHPVPFAFGPAGENDGYAYLPLLAK